MRYSGTDSPILSAWLAACHVGRGKRCRTNGNARGRLTIGTGTAFGFPPWACRWQVGGRKRGVAGRTSPPTTWGGINRKMLPYCESTEAFRLGKRQGGVPNPYSKA